INQIVHHQTMFTANFTDNVHHLGYVRVGSPLIDDRQWHIQPLGKRSSTLYPTGIRRDDDQLPPGVAVLKILDHYRQRKQVIDRNIEKTLNLSGMQIER